MLTSKILLKMCSFIVPSTQEMIKLLFSSSSFIFSIGFSILKRFSDATNEEDDLILL